MPQPLEGADLKVERANQHIHDLPVALDAFFERDPYAVVKQEDPDTGDCEWIAVVNEEPPPALSTIVGDAVHNLRSALDHLAYALVIANGGTPHRRTAYPISDTADKFEASLAHVQAAGQEAIDLIRATKAYKGRERRTLGAPGARRRGQASGADRHWNGPAQRRYRLRGNRR